jgi:hypothetical protein
VYLCIYGFMHSWIYGWKVVDESCRGERREEFGDELFDWQNDITCHDRIKIWLGVPWGILRVGWFSGIGRKPGRSETRRLTPSRSGMDAGWTGLRVVPFARPVQQNWINFLERQSSVIPFHEWISPDCRDFSQCLLTNYVSTFQLTTGL